MINNVFNLSYCVYAHYCDGDAVFIGWGKLRSAFERPDVEGWELAVNCRPVTVVILEQFFSNKNAAHFAKQMIAVIEPTTHPKIRLNIIERDEAKKDRRPIRCIQTGETFDTIADAGAYLGVSSGAISNVMKGRYKSVRGFTFERVPLG